MTHEIMAARIAIAKDVIATVEQRNYVEAYVYMSGVLPEPINGDWQEAIPQLEENCRVCALGSLVLSKAKLYNDCKPTTNNDCYVSLSKFRCVALLADYFDKFELEKIESFFERDATHPDMSDECLAYIRGAAVEGSKYITANERIVAAMQNIIANNGILVVSPVYKGQNHD